MNLTLAYGGRRAWPSTYPTTPWWSSPGSRRLWPTRPVRCARPCGARCPGRPLDELIGPDDRVVVVFPDITRPMPNTTVLPPLLAELDRVGAGPDRVELLCATGTHRPATRQEMAELVGPDMAGRYRIHDHRADDGDHVDVGRVEGMPVLLDRRYVEADVRIITGFVEPHFFAGWSGGPKGTCPGTGRHLHDPRGPQSGPDRRPPVHLAGHRGQSGPRVRPGGHRPVPARPVGGCDHRQSRR